MSTAVIIGDVGCPGLDRLGFNGGRGGVVPGKTLFNVEAPFEFLRGEF